jgi:molybdopterin-guanine dinucleotide biosynthesis protein B
MTIKHAHHPAEVDRPGSDSWRQFQEARAERVLLVTPREQVLFDRTEDTYDPIALARRHLNDADVVLVEGYKRAPIPKIEVFRRAVSATPLFEPGSPEAGRWQAIVTDDLDFDAPTRIIHFQDTMWLQLLATITLEQALPLDS